MMDFNSDQYGAPAPVEPPSSKSEKIITTIGILLFLGAAIGFGYLYWNERNKTASLQSQLTSAQSQKDKASEGNSSQLLAEAKAEYKAIVGKFTLTLPKEYYIIREHDGPFEGGPITKLSVATKDDKATQTVNAPSHEAVSISAVPLSGGTHAERVQNELSAAGDVEKKKLSTVKVDGADAEVYQLDGLFTDKKLFFTKNDIFYVITAGNAEKADSNSQKVLDEVIKGFKFSS